MFQRSYNIARITPSWPVSTPRMPATSCTHAPNGVTRTVVRVLDIGKGEN